MYAAGPGLRSGAATVEPLLNIKSVHTRRVRAALSPAASLRSLSRGRVVSRIDHVPRRQDRRARRQAEGHGAGPRDRLEIEITISRDLLLQPEPGRAAAGRLRSTYTRRKS